MPRKRGNQNGSVKQTGKTWTGTFYVYQVNRRLKRSKVLGLRAEMSKTQARDEVRKLARKAEQYVATNPQTLTDACERYLKIRNPFWSKLNAKNMGYLFHNIILPALGAMRLEDIQPSHVAELLAAVAGKYSRSITRKVRTHLKAVFEYLIDDQIVTRNPARRVKAPPTRKPCERFLLIEECRRLAAALSGQDCLIFETFLTCALRPSEVFGLRVNDIRADIGGLMIDEGLVPGEGIKETKTEGSKALVPITPGLLFRLMEHCEKKRPEDFIFVGKRGAAIDHRNWLNRNLKPAAERAGVPDVTQQCLRRTTATYMQNHGSLKDTQTLLRHTKASTTSDNYIKALPGATAAAVQSWVDELSLVVDVEIKEEE